MQEHTVSCTSCKKWIHKWSSGVRDDLSLVGDDLRCKRCDDTNQEVHLTVHIVVDGETYACVKSVCYLGDTLD